MKVFNADLHCHSTVSDGLLSPTVTVRRAHGNGVDLLALTDHDEIGGLEAAAAMAGELGMRFVNGVEISVSWGDDQTVHILGLGFDRQFTPLVQGLANVRGGRDSRARRIAAELDKVSIHGAYEGALKYVSNPALISRSHFARYIVELGHAKDVKGVFDWWLAKGKPGHVQHAWATMEEAVRWIHGAGGIAVVAHPGRYRLARAELARMLAMFKDLGGAASRWFPVRTTKSISATTRTWRVIMDSLRRAARTFTVQARAGSISVACRSCRTTSRRSGRSCTDGGSSGYPS